MNMPPIGLGTFELKGEVCSAAVRHALLAGYRMIDTATCYKNEQSIAHGIETSGVDRASIFITTKLQPGDQKGKDTVEAAVRRSLANLNTSYIDLYLIHWPGSKGRGPAHARPGPKGSRSTARCGGRVGVLWRNFTPPEFFVPLV